VEVVVGNGQLHGSRRDLGCLGFSEDSVAVDATCCRLIGISPSKIIHLVKANLVGNADAARIAMLGEPIAAMRQSFALV